jgi:hypothetical protein
MFLAKAASADLMICPEIAGEVEAALSDIAKRDKGGAGF